MYCDSKVGVTQKTHKIMTSPYHISLSKSNDYYCTPAGVL